jgi:hypothetical protein
VPKRMSAKVEVRDLAAEIIRRTRATAGSSDGGDSLPYVVRLSDPPTPHERLQLAACRILRHPIAIIDVRHRAGVEPKIWQAGSALVGVHEPQKPLQGRTRRKMQSSFPSAGRAATRAVWLRTLQSDIEDQFRVRCCNMKTATMLLWFALRPRGIRWYALWSWSG